MQFLFIFNVSVHYKMKNHVTLIQYNASNLEAIKRAVMFVFLSGIMFYALFRSGFRWSKENTFMLVFILFLLFTMGIGMLGYKKERTRSLSISNWRYRLYKNTNPVVYLLVRGTITTLIFIALFAAFQIKSQGIDAVIQKINVLYTGLPVLIILAGSYHLLIMMFIVRTGTAVNEND